MKTPNIYWTWQENGGCWVSSVTFHHHGIIRMSGDGRFRLRIVHTISQEIVHENMYAKWDWAIGAARELLYDCRELDSLQ